MPGHKAFMDLHFEPNWTYLSAVRNFIENFLAITFADARRASVVAMSVNELVENAIKYSDTAGFGIRLEIRDGNDIHVEVENHASAAQVVLLRDHLQAINGLDPEQDYVDRMRRIGNAADGPGSLGLSRIRYEARARLGLEETDGNIRITADFPSMTEVGNG